MSTAAGESSKNHCLRMPLNPVLRFPYHHPRTHMLALLGSTTTGRSSRSNRPHHRRHVCFVALVLMLTRAAAFLPSVARTRLAAAAGRHAAHTDAVSPGSLSVDPPTYPRPPNACLIVMH